MLSRRIVSRAVSAASNGEGEIYCPHTMTIFRRTGAPDLIGSGISQTCVRSSRHYNTTSPASNSMKGRSDALSVTSDSSEAFCRPGRSNSKPTHSPPTPTQSNHTVVRDRREEQPPQHEVLDRQLSKRFYAVVAASQLQDDLLKERAMSLLLTTAMRSGKESLVLAMELAASTHHNDSSVSDSPQHQQQIDVALAYCQLLEKFIIKIVQLAELSTLVPRRGQMKPNGNNNNNNNSDTISIHPRGNLSGNRRLKRLLDKSSNPHEVGLANAALSLEHGKLVVVHRYLAQCHVELDESLRLAEASKPQEEDESYRNGRDSRSVRPRPVEWWVSVLDLFATLHDRAPLSIAYAEPDAIKTWTSAFEIAFNTPLQERCERMRLVELEAKHKVSDVDDENKNDSATTEDHTKQYYLYPIPRWSTQKPNSNKNKFGSVATVDAYSSAKEAIRLPVWEAASIIINDYSRMIQPLPMPLLQSLVAIVAKQTRRFTWAAETIANRLDRDLVVVGGRSAELMTTPHEPQEDGQQQEADGNISDVLAQLLIESAKATGGPWEQVLGLLTNEPTSSSKQLEVRPSGAELPNGSASSEDYAPTPSSRRRSVPEMVRMLRTMHNGYGHTWRENFMTPLMSLSAHSQSMVLESAATAVANREYKKMVEKTSSKPTKKDIEAPVINTSLSTTAKNPSLTYAQRNLHTHDDPNSNMSLDEKLKSGSPSRRYLEAMFGATVGSDSRLTESEALMEKAQSRRERELQRQEGQQDDVGGDRKSAIDSFSEVVSRRVAVIGDSLSVSVPAPSGNYYLSNSATPSLPGLPHQKSGPATLADAFTVALSSIRAHRQKYGSGLAAADVHYSDATAMSDLVGLAVGNTPSLKLKVTPRQDLFRHTIISQQRLKTTTSNESSSSSVLIHTCVLGLLSDSPHDFTAFLNEVLSSAIQDTVAGGRRISSTTDDAAAATTSSSDVYAALRLRAICVHLCEFFAWEHVADYLRALLPPNHASQEFSNSGASSPAASSSSPGQQRVILSHFMVESVTKWVLDTINASDALLSNKKKQTHADLHAGGNPQPYLSPTLRNELLYCGAYALTAFAHLDPTLLTMEREIAVSTSSTSKDSNKEFPRGPKDISTVPSLPSLGFSTSVAVAGPQRVERNKALRKRCRDFFGMLFCEESGSAGTKNHYNNTANSGIALHSVLQAHSRWLEASRKLFGDSGAHNGTTPTDIGTAGNSTPTGIASEGGGIKDLLRAEEDRLTFMQKKRMTSGASIIAKLGINPSAEEQHQAKPKAGDPYVSYAAQLLTTPPTFTAVFGILCEAFGFVSASSAVDHFVSIAQVTKGLQPSHHSKIPLTENMPLVIIDTITATRILHAVDKVLLLDDSTKSSAPSTASQQEPGPPKSLNKLLLNVSGAIPTGGQASLSSAVTFQVPNLPLEWAMAFARQRILATACETKLSKVPHISDLSDESVNTELRMLRSSAASSKGALALLCGLMVNDSLVKESWKRNAVTTIDNELSSRPFNNFWSEFLGRGEASTKATTAPPSNAQSATSATASLFPILNAIGPSIPARNLIAPTLWQKGLLLDAAITTAKAALGVAKCRSQRLKERREALQQEAIEAAKRAGQQGATAYNSSNIGGRDAVASEFTIPTSPDGFFEVGVALLEAVREDTAVWATAISAALDLCVESIEEERGTFERQIKQLLSVSSASSSIREAGAAQVTGGSKNNIQQPLQYLSADETAIPTCSAFFTPATPLVGTLSTAAHSTLQRISVLFTPDRLSQLCSSIGQLALEASMFAVDEMRYRNYSYNRHRKAQQAFTRGSGVISHSDHEQRHRRQQQQQQQQPQTHHSTPRQHPIPNGNGIPPAILSSVLEGKHLLRLQTDINGVCAPIGEALARLMAVLMRMDTLHREAIVQVAADRAEALSLADNGSTANGCLSSSLQVCVPIRSSTSPIYFLDALCLTQYIVVCSRMRPANLWRSAVAAFYEVCTNHNTNKHGNSSAPMFATASTASTHLNVALDRCLMCLNYAPVPYHDRCVLAMKLIAFGRSIGIMERSNYLTARDHNSNNSGGGGLTSATIGGAITSFSSPQLSSFDLQNAHDASAFNPQRPPTFNSKPDESSTPPVLPDTFAAPTMADPLLVDSIGTFFETTCLRRKLSSAMSNESVGSISTTNSFGIGAGSNNSAPSLLHTAPGNHSSTGYNDGDDGLLLPADGSQRGTVPNYRSLFQAVTAGLNQPSAVGTPARWCSPMIYLTCVANDDSNLTLNALLGDDHPARSSSFSTSAEAAERALKNILGNEPDDTSSSTATMPSSTSSSSSDATTAATEAILAESQKVLFVDNIRSHGRDNVGYLVRSVANKESVERKESRDVRMSLLRAVCAVYPYPVVVKKMSGLGLVTHDLLRALRRDHTGTTWRSAMALYDRKIVQTISSLQIRQRQKYDQHSGLSLSRGGEQRNDTSLDEDDGSEFGDGDGDAHPSTTALFSLNKLMAIAHMRQRHEAALMLGSVTHAVMRGESHAISNSPVSYSGKVNPRDAVTVTDSEVQHIAAIAAAVQWPSTSAAQQPDNRGVSATNGPGNVSIPMPSRPLARAASSTEEADCEAQAAAHKARVASIERLLAKNERHR